MRKYEMQDRSAEFVNHQRKVRVDPGLSLQEVEHMTDWTAQELDDIASMNVGDEKLYGSGVYVKRTE